MDALSVDLLCKPGRFREVAGQIGLVSTLHHTASDVGHALVGQRHQLGQVILKMLN